MASTEVLKIDIAKIELNNPNELEAMHSPASSQSGEERVLIEKDGKFELVKAGDIQALPLESIITSVSTNTAMQPDHLQTETSTKNKTIPSGKPATTRNSLASKPNVSGKKLVTRTPPKHTPVHGLGSTASASSLIQPRRQTRPSTQPFTPGSSPRRDVRPQTAPLGPKSSSYFSLKGGERSGLAEEAFKAWLDLKDKQLNESVRSRAGTANPDGNTDREKRTANAYQSWMDNKRKQVLSELGAKERKEATERIQNKTNDSVTFERWLEGKSQFSKGRKGSNVSLTSFRKSK